MGTRKNSVYKSIARRCLECLGDRPSKCNMPECPIYGIRPGVKRSQSDSFTAGGKKLLPKFKLVNMLKAIRSECMVCTSGNPEHCTSPNCDFYQWRSGNSIRSKQSQNSSSISTQGGPNFDDCPESGDKAA
jgi:hypothetical protein